VTSDGRLLGVQRRHQVSQRHFQCPGGACAVLPAGVRAVRWVRRGEQKGGRAVVQPSVSKGGYRRRAG